MAKKKRKGKKRPVAKAKRAVAKRSVAKKKARPSKKPSRAVAKKAQEGRTEEGPGCEEGSEESRAEEGGEAREHRTDGTGTGTGARACTGARDGTRADVVAAVLGERGHSGRLSKSAERPGGRTQARPGLPGGPHSGASVSAYRRKGTSPMPRERRRHDDRS